MDTAKELIGYFLPAGTLEYFAQNEKLQLLEQKLIEILEENNTLKKVVKDLQAKTQKASR